MENIIFNELKIRGYDVDVGVVEHNTKDDQGKSQRNYLEVDFVANMGGKSFYIQSALNIDDEEKRALEINSLSRVNDSFRKIVVVRDNIEPWQDDNGIIYRSRAVSSGRRLFEVGQKKKTKLQER